MKWQAVVGVLAFWQEACLGLTLDSALIQSCPNTSEKIQIQTFKLDIDPNTNQLTLDIDAVVNSVLDSAQATVSLSIFGSQLFSLPFNLCKGVFNHLICPIQPGRLSQTYRLDVPPSVPNVASTISKVPGADLAAKLTIADSTGVSLGCVGVGLENPTSAHQPALIGATASLAGISAILALVSGLVGVLTSVTQVPGGLTFNTRPGPTPSFFDLFATIQFLATTGQLSLNYPPLFQQFTKNFGWSMGVISPNLARRSLDWIPSKNATSYSELSGVGSYARKLGVPPNSYFLTVLALFAMIMGAITLLVLVLRLVLEVLGRYRPTLFLGLRNHYVNYYAGNLLRVFLLCYFVLATAALFQLTLVGEALIRVVAGVVLGVFCILLMAVISALVIRAGPVVLYTDLRYNYRYGALYSDYRQPTYAFFLIVLGSALSRAVAVGSLGGYAWLQLAVLVVTEVVSLLALFLLRPYATLLGNNLMIFVGVLRVTNTALLFAFIQSFFLPDLARTVLAIAIIAIQGLTLLALAIMTLWGLIMAIARLLRSKSPRLPPSLRDTEPTEIFASDPSRRKENHNPPNFFRSRPPTSDPINDAWEETGAKLNTLSDRSITSFSSSNQQFRAPPIMAGASPSAHHF
ncbi:hypothetical protein L0F63_003137 [Massospora cicadina]|nr:hypothetical protein L0F63_003137 [Massospora cicadina]